VKERSMSKMKKKKQQKEMVRKEVNYWLDYDSPYAEYLVARFREWSPNVGVSIQSFIF
jgi:2-hydroxychromene-2-carboxylate isomerase